MTTLVSKFGSAEQKGTVLGIYRSLGALARALGPIVASVCEYPAPRSVGQNVSTKHCALASFPTAAFWCIGSRYTYILGGLALIVPTLMLQRSNIK